MRQVPDHQECYLDVEGGRLLALEILEQQAIDNENAPSFFFHDLAESNGATDLSFATQPDVSDVHPVGLPAEATLGFGSGTQKVRMGRDFDLFGNPRQQDVRTILVELCIIRLPSRSSDLLITLSSPSETFTPHTQPSDDFREVVSNLQIIDWARFG